MTETLTYAGAIRRATYEAMARDPHCVVLGQGLRDSGIWGTVPLDFDDQLLEMPLGEDSATGFAIGLAQAGWRPISVDIRMDFMMLRMNQIVNMAAKTRDMFGGALQVPMVFRAVVGRGWGQGASHSQALASMFVNIPGLNVCAPVTPQHAYDCMSQALQRNDPTIIMEHRLLHKTEGPVHFGGNTTHAQFLRHDPAAEVTLVGVSQAAVECLQAADLLAQEGVLANVISPVDLAPLDMEAVHAALIPQTTEPLPDWRPPALMVVECGWVPCGIGSEILTRAMRLGWRMGFEHRACPPTYEGERKFYPTAKRIAERAWLLVRTDKRTFPDIDTSDFKGPF